MYVCRFAFSKREPQARNRLGFYYLKRVHPCGGSGHSSLEGGRPVHYPCFCQPQIISDYRFYIQAKVGQVEEWVGTIKMMFKFAPTTAGRQIEDNRIIFHSRLLPEKFRGVCLHTFS